MKNKNLILELISFILVLIGTYFLIIVDWRILIGLIFFLWSVNLQKYIHNGQRI